MSPVAPPVSVHSASGEVNLELVDTGRTARTRGQLDLNSVEEEGKKSVTPPCVKAAPGSQKPERERKLFSAPHPAVTAPPLTR